MHALPLARTGWTNFASSARSAKPPTSVWKRHIFCARLDPRGLVTVKQLCLLLAQMDLSFRHSFSSCCLPSSDSGCRSRSLPSGCFRRVRYGHLPNSQTFPVWRSTAGLVYLCRHDISAVLTNISRILQMDNSIGQDPCLVSAFLQGACTGGRTHLSLAL